MRRTSSGCSTARGREGRRADSPPLRRVVRLLASLLVPLLGDVVGAAVEVEGELLRAVAGTPEAGEVVDGEVFDGETEAAIFPGELPERPEAVFEGQVPPGSLRFPRFRPPAIRREPSGRAGRLPQIRLDRALEFLIGDRLR